jgi:hypothetical protein
MPNPSKFKTEKDWMRGCMHQVMHLEKKERDQAVAQCLNMWRDWQKKKKRRMTRRVAGLWIQSFSETHDIEVYKQREKEKMKAAIKSPKTEKVYTGFGHKYILNQIEKEEGQDVRDLLWHELFKDNTGKYSKYIGFEDEKGRFFPREEAEKRMDNPILKFRNAENCGHIDDGIPTTESPVLPGTPLEKPTAKAVEALRNEHTCSSGWHSGFSPDFNGLEPCWAIVFDRHVSPMAIQCAEKAGLKVNVHQRGGVPLTDIYLPGVPKEEQDKASTIFNSFAEEYSKADKKTATIIRQYINDDARVISMHNPEL